MPFAKEKIYLVVCCTPNQISRMQVVFGDDATNIVGVADSEEHVVQLLDKTDPHRMYQYKIIPLDLFIGN